jgi:ATP-binding protein involved in chromosome partitioning
MTKQEILKVLETVTPPGEGRSLVESNAIKNVEIVENRVLVEVNIGNPTLQAKKRVEVDVAKAIKAKFENTEVQVHVVGQIATQQVNVTPKKERPLPNVKNLIAIASGKGGVGKSTVTANIAVTLAKMGFSVGILDADVYGPSMPIMFDVANERPTSVTIDGRAKIKPVENYGVKMLSLGFFIDPNDAVIWRGAMANKALNQLLFDADWGELDFMLIDLPPGTGDIHLSMVQAVPLTGAVIVSTPQPIALADAKKGVAMFAQADINVPVFGIVENMSYFTPPELPDNKYYIFGQDGAKHLAQDMDTVFLGELPIVQSIREAGDFGRPAAMQDNTPVEEAFTEITKNMLTQLVKRNKELPPTEIVRITNTSGCAAN